MKTVLPATPDTLSNILSVVAPLRNQGKTIVTTNGCFDIIHSGHIQYLSDAAACGDILIVGINSDSSVARLKGPTRPVQKEQDRAFILAALKMVDFVFVFDEPDPCAFLEQIRPDIHVKGGDYTPEKLPETAIVEKHGGKITIVPFLPGHSTTTLISRIVTQ